MTASFHRDLSVLYRLQTQEYRNRFFGMYPLGRRANYVDHMQTFILLSGLFLCLSKKMLFQIRSQETTYDKTSIFFLFLSHEKIKFVKTMI